MRYWLALTLGVATWISGVARGEDLIPSGSEWRWLHPTDGVDPGKEDKEFHKTWFTLDFDDAKWKEGKDSPGEHGGFAYGEAEFKGVDLGLPEADDPTDEKKTVKRRTAYFRHAFETDKDVEAVVLKLQRDDGVVVYLDGKEVSRDNVGLNDDTYELMAHETTSGPDETKVREYRLKTPLSKGKHILAISLHNRPANSSDLRIAEISLAEAGAEEAKSDKPADAAEKPASEAKPTEKAKP